MADVHCTGSRKFRSNNRKMMVPSPASYAVLTHKVMLGVDGNFQVFCLPVVSPTYIHDEYLQYQLGLIYGDGNYDADRPGYIIGQRNGQYAAPQAPPPPDWHGLGERIGDYILQGQPARGGDFHVHEEPQRQRRAGSERLTDILRGGRHVFGPARSQPQSSGGHRVDYHAQGPSNISVRTGDDSVQVHIYSDSSSDCHCRCNDRCDCDDGGSWNSDD
ncbi:hypothetical protein LTR17_000215 [Elasticomyces elasticus]|nr:hypothetical protein LTR17_000215 [Elasticomyces elasticus]